jgi:hypothetical protein
MSAVLRTDEVPNNVIDHPKKAAASSTGASPKSTKICPITYNDMRAWPESPVKQEAGYQARRRSSMGKPLAASDLAALAAHAKAIEKILAEFEAPCAAEHAKAEAEQSSTSNPQPARKPNGDDVYVACTEKKTFVRVTE